MKKTTYRPNAPRSKKTPFTKKRLAWAGGIVVVLAAALVISEVTNTTYFFHERKAVSSTITTAKPLKTQDTNKNNTTDNSSANNQSTTPTDTGTPSNTKESSPTNTSSSPLVEPYGDFVSNHHPGKNGAPTTEASVCLTTPGAQCYIKFTSAIDPSVVKTLAAGTADSSGAVYWNNWDVKAAGFTNGTWTIEAVATLNGQTKVTPDKTPLEVSL